MRPVLGFERVHVCRLQYRSAWIRCVSFGLRSLHGVTFLAICAAWVCLGELWTYFKTMILAQCWHLSATIVSHHLTNQIPKPRMSQKFLPPSPGTHSVLRGGFLKYLETVLRLRPSAVLFGGPPCGSFTWVNRATSRRSSRAPLGDGKKAYVKEANMNFD